MCGDGREQAKRKRERNIKRPKKMYESYSRKKVKDSIRAKRKQVKRANENQNSESKNKVKKGNGNLHKDVPTGHAIALPTDPRIKYTLFEI